MIVIFENNKWRVGWSDSKKTSIRIISRRDPVNGESKGVATASLGGSAFSYSDMDMGRRAPQIKYTNGGIVPSYIQNKVTLAFSRGQRWR